MIAINNDTSDILARFLTLPQDNYAELFEVEQERNELEEEIETLKSKADELADDISDLKDDIDSKDSRILELEAALADSLSWIQETLGGDVKAHSNGEFSRLWGIL